MEFAVDYSGIIATYRYRFALYNLLENPDLGILEAINLSKEQTYGYKWQLFVLDLSFLGWLILDVFTMGFLGIWLIPYITLTDIAFYDTICAEKRHDCRQRRCPCTPPAPTTAHTARPPLPPAAGTMQAANGIPHPAAHRRRPHLRWTMALHRQRNPRRRHHRKLHPPVHPEPVRNHGNVRRNPIPGPIPSASLTNNIDRKSRPNGRLF